MAIMNIYPLEYEMFITRDFSFIHLPKTGGTFVEAVLGQLHKQRACTLLKRGARKAGLPVMVELPKHGTWRDLPQKYQSREVLTVVRHPLDRYVSEYRYGRYLKHPEHFGQANPVIADRWPGLAEMDFDAYVKYRNQACRFLHFPGFAADDQPGIHTQHFLYFFARHLETCVRDLRPTSVVDGHLRTILPKTHYLMTHDLNRGLYDYLREQGYAQRRVRFILEMGRVMPEGGGRASEDHWSRYYTPELAAYVRRKERLLFELFPEFEASEREAAAAA